MSSIKTKHTPGDQSGLSSEWCRRGRGVPALYRYTRRRPGDTARGTRVISQRPPVKRWRHGGLRTLHGPHKRQSRALWTDSQQSSRPRHAPWRGARGVKSSARSRHHFIWSWTTCRRINRFRHCDWSTRHLRVAGTSHPQTHTDSHTRTLLKTRILD